MDCFGFTIGTTTSKARSRRSRSRSGDHTSRSLDRRGGRETTRDRRSPRPGENGDGYDYHPPSRYPSQRSRGNTGSGERNTTVGGSHPHDSRKVQRYRDPNYPAIGTSRGRRETRTSRLSGSPPPSRTEYLGRQRSASHEPIRARSSRQAAAAQNSDKHDGPGGYRVPDRAKVPSGLNVRSGQGSNPRGNARARDAGSFDTPTAVTPDRRDCKRDIKTNNNFSYPGAEDDKDSKGEPNKLPLDYWAGFMSDVERDVAWTTVKHDLALTYGSNMDGILRSLTENQRVAVVLFKLGSIGELSKRFDADVAEPVRTWQDSIFPAITRGDKRAGRYIRSILSGQWLEQTMEMESKTREPFYDTACREREQQLQRELIDVQTSKNTPDSAANNGLSVETRLTGNLREKHGPEHLFKAAQQRRSIRDR